MQIVQVAAPEHEEVWRIEDRDIGLTGFIAVHSTRLGPAAGGLRMRRYASEAEALNDALRLSRGMTFKNAAAGLPLGGGKAVIIGDPEAKTPAMLRAMGRAVERLEGRYWTAEDMGMTPADMAVVAKETSFVCGLPDGPYASGDPSPVTARGVCRGMAVAWRHATGRDSLAGARVALQGLGHVGAHLARLLDEAGARLILADVDAARVRALADEFGAEVAGPQEIHRVDADIFAPCAIGAILNAATIPELRVRLVAGAANNQLATDEDAARLHQRGILYAPDFIVNAGGIINAATEILRISDRAAFVEEKLTALEETLKAVLDDARARGVSPEAVAEKIVAERIEASTAA